MMAEGNNASPPYFAVVFTAMRSAMDEAGYSTAAARMEELARQRHGFLGVESVRGEDGLGITVSYWKDLDSIRGWRNDVEHLAAQARGRNEWYAWYRLRICEVHMDRCFEQTENG